MGSVTTGPIDYPYPQSFDRYPLAPRGDPYSLSTPLRKAPERELAITRYEQIDDRGGIEPSVRALTFYTPAQVAPGQIIDIWV